MNPPRLKSLSEGDFPYDFLHRNECEFSNEDESDDGRYDIFLCKFACEDRDQNIRDATDTDTVGNRIRKRHHDECEECRNCASHIGHIYVCEVLEHQNTYEDERGCGCARGNDVCKGSEEQTNEEAERGHKACEAGSRACCNAGSTFYKGCAGGRTDSSTGECADGVTSHGFVHIDGVAVFVEHARFGCGTVKCTYSVEHINDAEGDDKNDRGEYTADVAAIESELPSFCVEETCDTDFTEILECLTNGRKVEGGNLPCGNVIKNCGSKNADQNRTLDIALGENGDNDKAEEGYDSGSDCAPTVECGFRVFERTADVDELYERVLIAGNETCVLEADEGDEKTDTCGDGFLETFRHRFCNVFSRTCDGENHEDDTGKEYENHTGMVTADEIHACKISTGNEASAEERVETHAARLCIGKLCVKRIQHRTDKSNENGSDENGVPDLAECDGVSAETCKPAVCTFCRNLCGVDEDNVRHCKERCETTDDLFSVIRASFGDFEKLIHKFFNLQNKLLR